MNATYSGIYDAPITLTDGSYEGDPFVESDPARPSVEYIEGAELKGDLDDDGAEDAVVFLLERSGGSGAFTYVAAQLNRDGQPADAGAVLIEDRIGVKSAALEDGRITLEIITQGPGDAACCGMHKARRTYALQDGRLAETEAEGGGLVKLSVADLHGTNWTLLELDRDKPASAGAAVTLTFQDGQVGGSGGCNSYSASFSLGDDNPLAISVGPLIATGKSCADPAGSQESAYLAALGSVARWGYDFGRLVLYYAGGRDVESRLLFAPAGATEAVGADDSRAAAALTRNGFAIDGEQMAALDGQVIRLWRVEPKPANDVAPTEERSALPPATLAVKTATLASTHWQANPSQ
jgi:heat shock protein HslJ